MSLELIEKCFPELSEKQKNQLVKFEDLIHFWNDKINVISRKDIDNLMAHHILHSLFIKKVIDFSPEASILDLGTGGGFPGIPLAICFPETSFHLIDARSKKIKVVDEVIELMGLKNVTAEHRRAEELKSKYDFVVTRAVAKLDVLLSWTRPLIKEEEKHGLPNGLITLKGGDIDSLKSELPKFEYIEDYSISDWCDLEYYLEKYIIYVQA